MVALRPHQERVVIVPDERFDLVERPAAALQRLGPDEVGEVPDADRLGICYNHVSMASTRCPGWFMERPMAVGSSIKANGVNQPVTLARLEAARE